MHSTGLCHSLLMRPATTDKRLVSGSPPLVTLRITRVEEGESDAQPPVKSLSRSDERFALNRSITYTFQCAALRRNPM